METLNKNLSSVTTNKQKTNPSVNNNNNNNNNNNTASSNNSSTSSSTSSSNPIASQLAELQAPVKNDNPDRMATIAAIVAKRGKDKTSHLSQFTAVTTTYCHKSGLPIAADNYFGQRGNKIRFSQHWIFSQNPATILQLALTAKTVEEKYLTQLAMLDKINLIEFRKPASLTNSQVKLHHRGVVKLFLVWLKAPADRRKTLVGGNNMLPQIAVDALSKAGQYNFSQYNIFIDLVTTYIQEKLFLTSLDYADELLQSEEIYLPEFELQLRRELRQFEKHSPSCFNKKLGRELLESLAELPENEKLRNQFQELSNYLLNDGFKSSEGFSTVYRAILESHTEDYTQRDHKKVTLDFLARQIDILLAAEAGFFGKKVFETSTGQIRNDAQNMEVLSQEDIEDFLGKKEKTSLHLPAKRKLLLKVPTRLKK